MNQKHTPLISTPYVTRPELELALTRMKMEVLEIVVADANTTPGGAAIAAEEASTYANAQSKTKKRKSTPPAPTRPHNQNAR
jgi:hypothetical protein